MTVAVPGLDEGAAGTLHEAPNLGWVDVPIANRLRHALGEPSYPVLLDNEANLAALAEIHAGGARDLLLLTGAVGVGGGMVSTGVPASTIGGATGAGSCAPGSHSPSRPQLSNPSHWAVLHWFANSAAVVGVP